ncbi:indolepyruvate ferredoxin oxidoreductase beta subunit [Tistlia consotensis]|uniref:Indolepyruvate ferredoxin oxidoreductase beta subunit n=1 Tax=Tistlia consotensis USBA 355 TaxID=560819 RepID=A0A1Y6CE86_9PROT|nr:indolepyruvate oxidoreductase subunit beta family protein [Tistlia consotensis]SMF58637.1 indolepyruvate ferredoxin oxidoreductase beta subunit [Tistlia consotensis USBA 355]SNR63451.1 indolepyruvate ferredoxin oxidoreductase beta subunit [Tistlia consotensis]
MTAGSPRNVAILIAALGGEGGGVLADWVAAVLRDAGYLCQTTSIPGVAQRTGATTYYIEYCSVPLAELGRRRPVFALTPVPGEVDVMLASELIEAARGVQNGYVTPERTTLIASSHRIYATAEKIAPGDGRFDDGRALKAVHELARRAVVFDMARATEAAGTVISAVLLGALAGAGALPAGRETFEAAIRAGGRGVEASLKGFALGFEAARGEPPATAGADPEPSGPATAPEDFPVETRYVVGQGLARCRDYQDRRHAEAYLARCREILALDRRLGGADRGWLLTNEACRFLALRMTYEDVIRVADLKSRPERYATLRRESRSGEQPLRITDFFKPGPEELCALLPVGLAERFLAALRRRGLERRFHLGLPLRSDTVTGFLLLRLVARLRGLRRGSWRWAQESAVTGRWLAATTAAAELDYAFGVEAARTADLVKGYSDTYRRGLESFDRLLAGLVEPAIAAGRQDAAGLARARTAALADPEGGALERYLAELEQPAAAGAPERRAVG